MPSAIATRRAYHFRPAEYSFRHQQVAALIAAGLRRDVVAELTGYSPGHVSRISKMPAARRDIADRLCEHANRLERSLLRRIIALLPNQGADGGMSALDFVLEAREGSPKYRSQ